MRRTEELALALIVLAFLPVSCMPSVAKEYARRVEAPRPLKTVVLDDFDGEFLWKLEEGWGLAAEVGPGLWRGGKKGSGMDVRFKVGDKNKIVVGRDLGKTRDLSAYNAVLIDINNKLEVGCMVSLGLITMPNWKYAESTPKLVPPGPARDVLFRLDATNFKSEASGWKYKLSAGDLSKVQKIVLLVYPICDGQVQVDNLRLATVPPTKAPEK